MTAGKRAMIRQSMLPLDQFIDEHVETREYPFHWDVVNTSSLVKPLMDFGLKNVNTKEIANAFRRLGYLELTRTRVGEDKVRMWAVRDFDSYSEMNGVQLRALWIQQVNATPREPGPETVDALYKDRPRNPVKDSVM
jgi:hypothetical protein